MVRATIGRTVVADSSSVALLEGHKYFPPAGVRKELLTQGNRACTCPWKGRATYWDIHADGKVYPNAAWRYETPNDAAKSITGHVSFDTSVVSVTG